MCARCGASQSPWKTEERKRRSYFWPSDRPGYCSDHRLTASRWKAPDMKSISCLRLSPPPGALMHLLAACWRRPLASIPIFRFRDLFPTSPTSRTKLRALDSIRPRPREGSGTVGLHYQTLLIGADPACFCSESKLTGRRKFRPSRYRQAVLCGRHHAEIKHAHKRVSSDGLPGRGRWGISQPAVFPAETLQNPEAAIVAARPTYSPGRSLGRVSSPLLH